jgi:hypothetical protein
VRGKEKDLSAIRLGVCVRTKNGGGGVGLLKKESFIRKSKLFQKKLWQKQALRKSLDQKQALRKTSFLRKSKLFKKKLRPKTSFLKLF